MEQKNTIVKCLRHNCLWNHRGTCDQYVIPIDANGQCGAFVETAPIHEEIDLEALAEAEELYQCATEMLERQGVTLIPSSSESMRGQRAKCDFFEDMMDIDDTHLGEVVTVEMKIAELNKPNKNKSTIKDVVPECDLPICDWSCKHALRSGPTFNPDLWCDKMKGKPAVGLFCSDYEEAIDEV